jgi:hypothetical protein
VREDLVPVDPRTDQRVLLFPKRNQPLRMSRRKHAK